MVTAQPEYETRISRHPLLPKVCDQCGVSFQGARATKYCSTRCRRRHYTISRDARLREEGQARYDGR